jgi:hypothetical protein
MFDLEESIAEWRQQMLGAGIKTPVPLEELEIHLRDAIERLVKSGINAQRAFGEAIRQIGPPNILKSEFQKANAPNVKRQRTTVIAGGVLTILVGFVLIWATVVQSRDLGNMSSEVAGLLVLGLILVFDGAAISFLASKPSFLAAKH